MRGKPAVRVRPGQLQGLGAARNFLPEDRRAKRARCRAAPNIFNQLRKEFYMNNKLDECPGPGMDDWESWMDESLNGKSDDTCTTDEEDK